MDNGQIGRIGVHKTGLFFIEEFDWIEREQPISDHGIDYNTPTKTNNQKSSLIQNRLK